MWPVVEKYFCTRNGIGHQTGRLSMFFKYYSFEAIVDFPWRILCEFPLLPDVVKIKILFFSLQGDFYGFFPINKYK